MVLCVHVCMPLDIGSHACFPVNLKASGWSQGCGFFSHSLPPSLIPEELLLLGYSATLSISPGKSWSRGGPPHILSTDLFLLPISSLTTLCHLRLWSNCLLSPAVVSHPTYVPLRAPPSLQAPKYQRLLFLSPCGTKAPPIISGLVSWLGRTEVTLVWIINTLASVMSLRFSFD